MIRSLFLFLFILLDPGGIISAQSYEVSLRLSTRWRLDQLQFDNLHMQADYDMYEHHTDILGYL
ncbi:MAG: hypothetical protein AAF696_20580, partial [Bacteroidota bacterium]